MSVAPRALDPFLRFPALLRAGGFAVAPDQTIGFIQAVELLGPRTMQDIYRAAIALFAPAPERRDAFDAVFRLVFHGQSLAGPAGGEPNEDDLRVHDDRDGGFEPEDAEIEESGGAATRGEVLAERHFGTEDEAEALRRLRREGRRRLPRRASHRRAPDRRGDTLDMRRTMREAVRRDGEVMALPRLRRRQRGRRILVLIDVSGSMKRETGGALRFAHALARTAETLEVFTLGTRLTRVSRALRARVANQALDRAASLVPDWDGGTRLGDALGAFLSVPRFAGFARGALVLVISDGLERGDPAAMVDAVRRLSRLAWRLEWLTPLAADAGYAPQTAALKAALPFIDTLAAGGSVERLCSHLLGFARQAP